MPLNEDNQSLEFGVNETTSTTSLIRNNSSNNIKPILNSNKKRVVTTPAWARNLPPDDLPDYDSPPDNRRTSTTTSFSNNNNNNNNNKKSTTNLPHSSSHHNSSPSSSTHHPLTPTSLTQPLPTYIPQSGSSGIDKWWTFTIPSKYGERVRDYVHSGAGLLSTDGGEKGKSKSLKDGEEGEGGGEEEKRFSKDFGKDLEKGAAGGGGEGNEESNYLRMGTRLAPGVFSANQTLTPGWSAPWAPFRRETSRDSQDFTPFRFSEEVPEIPTKMSKTRTFILENVFAPLVFRFFNLSANICTLALGSHIRLQEKDSGLPGIMGSSTLMAVCISPLALVHIFVTLYIEYFGRPIGLWAISTKMFHTLTELIFICLWSSAFSLSLDDLFTSPLQCASTSNYYENSITIIAGDPRITGTLANKLCEQQEALIVMIFGSLTLCSAVLVVSLFRIFARVSKKH